jgi:mRNA deadenylase 3'-5' endonuclease subunit Ccr4
MEFWGLDVQVQSDHYEDFYAPELEKHGYTGVYKKKTGEVRLSLCPLLKSLFHQLKYQAALAEVAVLDGHVIVLLSIQYFLEQLRGDWLEDWL